MLTVAHIDVNPRVRTCKEIIAGHHTHPKGIRYILIMPGKSSGNKAKIPWVPIYKIGKNHRVHEIIKICKKEEVDILQPHTIPVMSSMDVYSKLCFNIRNKTGIPFVQNVHDAAYNHVPVSTRKQSVKMYHAADRLLTVGDGMTDFLNKQYKVPKEKCFPLLSLPNRKFLPDIRPMSGGVSRCVYQGGIKLHNSKGNYYNHRYYKDIFQRLTRQGISMNIYPTKNSSGRYPTKGVQFMPKVSGVDNLYKTLARYDFGFSGFYNSGGAFLDFAMPNKLFEYVGSGIPVLAMDYKSIGGWVRDNGFGVVINRKTLKLPSGWKDQMRKAKKNVAKHRDDWVMEKQMVGLMQMYKELVD